MESYIVYEFDIDLATLPFYEANYVLNCEYMSTQISPWTDATIQDWVADNEKNKEKNLAKS